MGLQIPCPKCRGKKTMNDPQYIGKMMGYCDRDGNTCPQVTCITCHGVGHVIDRSSPYAVDEDAVKKQKDEGQKQRIWRILGEPEQLRAPTLEELEQQLQEAIDAQDYERCATLRDEIERRKGH